MTARVKAPARRRRGLGGVRDRKRGVASRWEARWTDEAGRPQHSYHPTEAAAKDALIEALSDRVAGLPVQRRMTVAAWLTEWHSTHVDGVMRPTTARLYGGMIANHLVPELGRLQLTELRDTHVRQLHRSMAKAGLSERTIAAAHATLSSALSQAMSSVDLKRNVAKLVSPPRAKPRVDRDGQTMHVPSDDDLLRVLDATAGSDLEPLLRLMIATGMRQGEALALSWSDLTISHQLTGLKPRVRISATVDPVTGLLGPTKTRESARTIRLSVALADILNDHRRRMAARGWSSDDAAPVFVNEAGNRLGADSLRQQLKRACARAGVQPFSPHAIRHRYATTRLTAGDAPLSVSRSMGHTRVSTTHDLYGHGDGSDLAPLDELDARPANVLPMRRTATR